VFFFLPLSSLPREANDLGYWCLLLDDATAATLHDNHNAAIRQIKVCARYMRMIATFS
jgi:hypothetical protein